MKSKSSLNRHRSIWAWSQFNIIAGFMAGLYLFNVQAATAGSATWKLNPTSNDWNTAANWTPETVPSESGDIATFDRSTMTDIDFSNSIAINSIVFEPEASAYTIIFNRGFYGAGVVNNSGVTQNVDSSEVVGFHGTATAGSNIIYTSNGNSQVGMVEVFLDNSNAGNATFIMNGALPGDYSATLFFENHSDAAESTIINNGPRGGENGGDTYIFDSASAGHSTMIGNAGSFIEFSEDATAAEATLIIDGGELHFEGRSDGGLAQVQLAHGGLVLGHSPRLR